MTSLRSRSRSRSLATRLTVATVLALGLGAGLTACSGTPVDNIVEGVVGDQVREALGGDVDIATDGQLPAGYPADAVPVTGDVQGGASAGGAGGAGWTVLTTVTGTDSFAEAKAALEGAGFTTNAEDIDASSGYASFDSAEYDVNLTYSTVDGVVTATYIVTPGGGQG